MTPSNTVNALVNTSSTNTLAQTSGANVLKLAGFENALKKLEQKCASPGEIMTRENALYALVTINGVGGGLISGLTSSNITATALNGATIIASGATQLHDFFSHHFSIQEQQERLVKAIAAAKVGSDNVIGRCTSVRDSVVNRTADAILEALSKYGFVKIVLANGKDFQLKNNGICSIRLGMGSVVSLGLSMGFAAAYGYFQYQAIKSGQGVSDDADVAVTTTSREVWGVLAGASVPINKLYEYCVRSSYNQELDLLKAIDEIVKLYQDKSRLHELPIEVLQVSENYIDKDDVTTNYNLLSQAQTDAKIHLTSETHKSELDVANRKIERLEGALSTANTTLGDMERKMHDIEMQHTMTESEAREAKAKVEFLQQHMIDAANVQETTRLLDDHNNGAPMLTQQQIHIHSQANQTQANSANTAFIGEGNRKTKPGCTIC